MSRKLIHINYLLGCLSLGVFLICSCSQDQTTSSRSGETKHLTDFSDKSGEVNIAGGTAHIPVMQKAAKDIMSYNPKIKITIAGGGSGVGAQQVGKGLVDIGNTGRPLKEKEQAMGLVSHAFAIDGVAIILHPDNPISALTSEQVAKVFAGTITNWKELGGPDKAIHLFTRDEASGTRAVFVKKLLKNGPVAQHANVTPSNGSMKTSIASDSGAIGYCSIGYIDDMIKAPQLDGVEPTNANCVSGSYPVMRKLYMNTKGEPEGLVKTFIDFICSKNAASYIKASGYIPLHAED
ncbi:MAG: phosphate ABC transporter substrate-binding protein [Verrucomicrobiae bacterium]|nr:phosphate ABC transporter substrate-binding protein [Verrucomicrobiae bacterium]NNJ86609.1 phosphate ABC transporter substrate-binding protein [Akkermansiaceae bacterium]